MCPRYHIRAAPAVALPRVRHRYSMVNSIMFNIIHVPPRPEMNLRVGPMVKKLYSRAKDGVGHIPQTLPLPRNGHHVQAEPMRPGNVDVARTLIRTAPVVVIHASCNAPKNIHLTQMVHIISVVQVAIRIPPAAVHVEPATFQTPVVLMDPLQWAR